VDIVVVVTHFGEEVVEDHADLVVFGVLLADDGHLVFHGEGGDHAHDGRALLVLRDRVFALGVLRLQHRVVLRLRVVLDVLGLVLEFGVVLRVVRLVLVGRSAVHLHFVPAATF